MGVEWRRGGGSHVTTTYDTLNRAEGERERGCRVQSSMISRSSGGAFRSDEY